MITSTQLLQCIIQYYKNISSQKAQKYDLQYMNSTKEAHELQGKILRAGQKKTGKERATTDLIAPQEKSDL